MNRSLRTALVAALAAAALTHASTARAAGPADPNSAITDLAAQTAVSVAIPAPERSVDPADNSTVHISQIWTADASGYRRTSFRRGERMRLMASLRNTSRTAQYVRVSFTATEPGWFAWCEMSCPPSHSLYRGTILVQPGTRTYSVAALVESRDPVGQWTYLFDAAQGNGIEYRQVGFWIR